MKLSATGTKPAPALDAPAKATFRIQTLDVIRGVAILGILAVNADGFAAPMSAALHIYTWLFAKHGWSAFLYSYSAH